MSQLQRMILMLLAVGVMSLTCTRASTAEDQSAYSNVVFPDQGWTDDDRLRYYYTSQGSAAMSYDIFLNLEAASEQTLFRSDDNMARYGLIPQASDPKYNPDGLPIGITKTVVTDGRWKGQWVGLGCAACHTGQLEYKGTKIRISAGSAAHFDIFAFIGGLDDALAATVADPQKFARLAERLGRNDNRGKDDLRTRLLEDAAAIHNYRTLDGFNTDSCRPRPYGCARTNSQSGAIKRDGGPGKLEGTPCAGEAIILLECSAVSLGPVERRAEGSYPSQLR